MSGKSSFQMTDTRTFFAFLIVVCLVGGFVKATDPRAYVDGGHNDPRPPQTASLE
jgi:hypothetical protein